MWKRAHFLPALALLAASTALPAFGASPINGTGDVKVVGVRLLQSSDASTGFEPGSITWVVASLDLTNDTGSDYTPDISRFFLTLPAAHEHVAGVEGGDPVLIGIRNNHDVLHAGETRRYTVAFRTLMSAPSGTISYEP